MAARRSCRRTPQRRVHLRDGCVHASIEEGRRAVFEPTGSRRDGRWPEGGERRATSPCVNDSHLADGAVGAQRRASPPAAKTFRKRRLLPLAVLAAEAGDRTLALRFAFSRRLPDSKPAQTATGSAPAAARSSPMLKFEGPTSRASMSSIRRSWRNGIDPGAPARTRTTHSSPSSQGCPGYRVIDAVDLPLGGRRKEMVRIARSATSAT
jgi:hypothetical protein